MNKIILNIFAITGIIALIAFVFVGVLAFTTYSKQVKNEAIFQCATSSKYEIKDGKATVSYPVKDLFDKCLTDKGIK